MVGFEVADDGFDGGTAALECAEFFGHGVFAVETINHGWEFCLSASIAIVASRRLRDNTGDLECLFKGVVEGVTIVAIIHKNGYTNDKRIFAVVTIPTFDP